MSGHATAESLSLYLDAALPAAERRQVEDHLGACPQCRHRLDGLRRVVAGLGRLPTAAPPADLGARVTREADLRGRRSRWHRLLAGGLPVPLVAAPPMHLLALVLALGAIVYLFAQGVERRADRPTRIVLPGAESLIAEPPAAAAQPLQMARTAGDELDLLGGRFERRDGVWVERGLAGRPPDTRVTVDAGGYGAAAVPEVAELAALGAPLRLRVGEQVVEIACEAAAHDTSLQEPVRTPG
jgi:anti-sigma factor RsiW